MKCGKCVFYRKKYIKNMKFDSCILFALVAIFNTINIISSNEQPTKEDPLKFAKDTA